MSEPQAEVAAILMVPMFIIVGLFLAGIIPSYVYYHLFCFNEDILDWWMHGDWKVFFSMVFVFWGVIWSSIVRIWG